MQIAMIASGLGVCLHKSEMLLMLTAMHFCRAFATRMIESGVITGCCFCIFIFIPDLPAMYLHTLFITKC